MPKTTKPKPTGNDITIRVLGPRPVGVGGTVGFVPQSNEVLGTPRPIPTGNDSDGTYQPWSEEKIDAATLSYVRSDWIGSSSDVRHAIQGAPNSNSDVTVKQAQEFDDWLNSGSYDGVLYRGKGVSKAEYSAIMSLEPGDLYGQDGPSSFSKSESVARSFANAGFSPADSNMRVVFVLEGGTNCGRDVSMDSGFAEHEVIVGSASQLVLTKPPETVVVNGYHYTYVYGYELQTQYVPSKAE